MDIKQTTTTTIVVVKSFKHKRYINQIRKNKNETKNPLSFSRTIKEIILRTVALYVYYKTVADITTRDNEA